MANKTFQITVALQGSKPPIWRRLLVDSNTSLIDLHKILQTTMGWLNAHLHMFSDGKHEYAPEEFELEDTKDSEKVRLDKLLTKEGAAILYEYDFGDGWLHKITLEKVMPAEKNTQIPRCIAGRGSCPPEDVGGIGGYAMMLNVLKNPQHEEYDSYLEWLGGEFDPDHFNKEEVNELLQEEDFGCLWL